MNNHFIHAGLAKDRSFYLSIYLSIAKGFTVSTPTRAFAKVKM